MPTLTQGFKTFPEFSKLTLADRKVYEAFVADFPPITDISFAPLMSFWNVLDSCAVSSINGNLVISYWLPGKENESGLSLVGSEKLDESICTVLDHLRNQGEPVRLVHVPEFVISKLRFPELFRFVDERAYDECVVPISPLCSLDQIAQHKRRKMRRFLAEVEDKALRLENLDLSQPQNQDILLKADIEWRSQGGLNNLGQRETEAFHLAVTEAETLGFKSICAFIGDELQGCMLYQLRPKEKYVLLNFARFNYDIPHLFEYLVYRYAQWFDQKGIEYANIECDLGLPILRNTKLALGPSNFFRKYTIKPS